jgi:hypothetical protein
MLCRTASQLVGMFGIWPGFIGMPGMFFIMSCIWSQHILPEGEFCMSGPIGALGVSAGLEVSVNAPDEPAHVPAKNAANAMARLPNAAATNRLRSRRLRPTLLKAPMSSPFTR